MQRAITMLLTTIGLLLSVPAFTQSAAAAPAQPYTESGCLRIVPDGVEVDLCYFVRETLERVAKPE